MARDLLENKAFEELFDLHYGNLVGFVYGYVRDEEVAKDIVHDAFLTFWTNRKHLDLSYSAKSYLFTLAQNYALNYLRHLRVVEVNEREVTALLESASEELLDVSINTIKKHMTRALKFLRGELQDETVLLFVLKKK